MRLIDYNRWLPQALVWRLFVLYAATLVIFIGLGMGLFYRYQFEQALEDVQQSALMLTEVTAQTITESAVIGDSCLIIRQWLSYSCADRRNSGRRRSTDQVIEG